MSSAPIPVTLLTGFLGAGKTTFLNRLLGDPAMAGAAVIVNEFGEVGIDHLLVERATDGLIELSDGCICCSVRGDLVDTLAGLIDRIQTRRLAPLSRVVIETTGLADPTPVLAALMAHPVLLQHFALDGVVTLVDAFAGFDTLQERREAQRQVACADRILLSKLDLGPLDPRLEAVLAQLNPRAPRMEARGAGAEAVTGCGLIDPATGRADPCRWLGANSDAPHHHDHHGHHHAHHHHDAHGDIGSFSLVHDAPIALSDLQGFTEMLGSIEGPRLLRMKAIVRTREMEDRPLALHAVRGYVHPPVRLPAWPDGEARRSRLVLIGDGLNETMVRDLFAAFVGEPRLDAPDRTALLDNPLSLSSRGF